MAPLGPAFNRQGSLQPRRMATNALWRLGRCKTAPPTRRIDAPGAASREKEIQEDEAVEDRCIAFIENGKEALWRMCHEVGDRQVRQDARRVGNEWVSQCRSWWPP